MSQKPIVVHTMGRVGSSTVAFACEELSEYQTFHTHFLNPDSIADLVRKAERKGREVAGNIRRSLAVMNDYFPTGCDIKMVTLVRDPVARNLSGCFANFLLKTKDQPHAPLTRSEVEEYFENFYHERPEWWFDREMKVPLGIDLLARPFPKEQQFDRQQHGKFDILVMQTELQDATKLSALREFLDTDEIDLEPRNVHAVKDERYNDFLAYAPISEDYMDRFYNLPYVKHFYSDDAIEGFRRRWSERQTA